MTSLGDDVTKTLRIGRLWHNTVMVWFWGLYDNYIKINLKFNFGYFYKGFLEILRGGLEE